MAQHLARIHTLGAGHHAVADLLRIQTFGVQPPGVGAQQILFAGQPLGA